MPELSSVMQQLIIVCAILFVLSVVFSRHRWYAPTVLLTGVWLACVIAYAWIDRGMHPLHTETKENIMLWLVCFCLTAWSVQSLYVKPVFQGIESSVSARDIYYYLTLFTLPVLALAVVSVVLHSGGNPFSALRDANVRENAAGIRTTGFFVIFWMVSYIMELHVVSKDNIGRVILLFLVNLFYAFISMGKMNFMILFLASAIILSERKIVKVWHLAVGGVLLIMAFVGIQTIRGSYTTPERFAALYMTSSIANLDTNVKPCSAEHAGENTFRLYYAVKSKLDGGRTQPVDPILEFKRVEIGDFVFGSNTFTALYPYYKDFGRAGVVGFAILLGLIFGYLFKTAEDGSLFSLVLYAILAGTIVMQFIGDTFFTVLSQNIQYLIAALIPYIISKYNLFANLHRRNG